MVGVVCGRRCACMSMLSHIGELLLVLIVLLLSGFLLRAAALVRLAVLFYCCNVYVQGWSPKGTLCNFV